jgi:hypothetical protein
LNTYCFVPCGKQTSACISKAVMATWNGSNHFGTPCIAGPFSPLGYHYNNILVFWYIPSWLIMSVTLCVCVRVRVWARAPWNVAE